MSVSEALHTVLVILAQSSIAAKPSEAALHNPCEVYDLERALLAFDDLQLPAIFGATAGVASAAFRSEMLAGSTLHAISSPKVSTRMWRLRPFTRWCASNPRMPPRSVVFTD